MPARSTGTFVTIARWRPLLNAIIVGEQPALPALPALPAHERIHFLRLRVHLQGSRRYPGARIYALAGSRTVDGSATTFNRDKAAMLRLLPQLEKVFGAWNSFDGMALHELR